jgi:hypothetical protein
MSLRIDNVTAAWTGWSAATGDNTATIGREHWLRWGTPLAISGGQSSYVIRGEIPPIIVKDIGVRFRLLRFRHMNRIIADAGITYADMNVSVTSPDVGSASFSIRLLHTETPNSTGDPWLDRDFVNIDGGFPKTVNIGTAVLNIIGFEQDGQIVDEFQSPEEGENTAYLVAEVVDDGSDYPACSSETDPIGVFDSEKCDVPCIPPIPDLTFIEDCEVPIAPDPILDCPDLDIPAIRALGVVAITSPDGGGGGPTEPVDPCEVKITSSYQVIEVSTEEEIGVFVTRTRESECHWHFHYTMKVYYGHAAAKEGCCAYVWCPCPDDPVGDVGYTADDNCPKTDTCGEAAGHWVLLADKSADYCADMEEAPCTVGDYFGQMETKCLCPESESSSSFSSSLLSSSSSSSSSSIPGPGLPTAEDCCGDVELPETLVIRFFTTHTCENLAGFNGSLTYDVVEDAWIGYLVDPPPELPGHTIKFRFKCFGEIAGLGSLWMLELFDTRLSSASEGEGPYDYWCATTCRAAADSCEPLEWGYEGPGNHCCIAGDASTLSVRISEI